MMYARLPKILSGKTPQRLRARAQAEDQRGRAPEAITLWRELAETGDVDACFIMGERYEIGRGAVQNFIESARWFRIAANAGHLPAVAKLGEIYFHGRGSVNSDDASASSIEQAAVQADGSIKAKLLGNDVVEPDFSEAERWNREAAKAGDAAAQVRLAFQYSSGQGLAESFQQAEHWFTQAAAQGHDGGALGLALLHAGGHGRPTDLGKAAEWFTKSAERGNSAAQLSLGLLYLRGDGVVKDEARAEELFKQAADQGQVEAMTLLGQMHRFGLSTQVNTNDAETWLKRAALRGHTKAMASLGNLLLEGPRPDPITAAGFLKEAADAGDGEAQFALACLYHEGRGVAIDCSRAIELFEAAAEHGIPAANERLGTIYAEGLGVKRDEARAIRCYERAAKSGSWTALFNLGVMEEARPSAFRDLRRVHRFYELAAQAGSGEACLRLGLLSAGDGLSDDMSAAAEWFAKGADLGNLDASCNLGLLAIQGRLVDGTIDAGIQTLEAAAQRGGRSAAWALHNIYREGSSVPPNELIARHWLEVAAETGCAVAAGRLTAALQLNDPLALSADRIVALLTPIAEQGDPEAQNALGQLYWDGRHVGQNMSEAWRWLSRAGQAGHPEAQCWLGDALSSGEYALQDRESATGWYRKAARSGDKLALHRLTAIFLKSANDEDRREIFVLWQEHASAGDAEAERTVGEFFTHGTGTEASVQQAAYWLNQAAKHGDQQAREMLVALKLNS